MSDKREKHEKNIKNQVQANMLSAFSDMWTWTTQFFRINPNKNIIHEQSSQELYSDPPTHLSLGFNIDFFQLN